MVGKGARGVKVALHHDPGIHRRPQTQNPQQIAVLHGLATAAGRQVGRDDDPVLRGIDARQHGLGGVCLRRQTPGE